MLWNPALRPPLLCDHLFMYDQDFIAQQSSRFNGVPLYLRARKEDKFTFFGAINVTQEDSRKDDFKRNTTLQYQNNVATLCCAKNVASNLL